MIKGMQTVYTVEEDEGSPQNWSKDYEQETQLQLCVQSEEHRKYDLEKSL